MSLENGSFLKLLSDLQRDEDVISRFDNPNTREELLNNYDLTEEEMKASLNYEDHNDELFQLMRDYAAKGLANLHETDVDEPRYESDMPIQARYTDIFRFLFDVSYNQESRESFLSNHITTAIGYKWGTSKLPKNEQIHNTVLALYEAYKKDPSRIDNISDDLKREMEQLIALLAC